MSIDFMNEKILRKNEFEASVRSGGVNDFVFLYRLDEDEICLSNEIVKKLNLPSNEFKNAFNTLCSICHPDDLNHLKKAFGYLEESVAGDFVSEFRLENKKGCHVPVTVHARLLSSKNGGRILSGIIAERMNPKDFVTDLPQESQMRLDYEFQLEKNGPLTGFIIELSIKDLENINEVFGQDAGNEIICLFAKAVEDTCEGNAHAYRLGGNRIAVMNVTGLNARDAEVLYSSLKRKVSEIEHNLDFAAPFSISAGLVAFCRESSDLKYLMKKADFALNMGKKSEKNSLYFFNSAEYSKSLNRIHILEKLRESIKNDFKGFEIFYQPVVGATEIKSSSEKIEGINVIGAEALLRWSSPETGLLGADQIIPILEESGLIAPVGRWVFLKAFTQCRMWNQYDEGFHMNVNLSYMQFKRSDLVADVQMALEKSQVNPENITLEITESGYINQASLDWTLEEFRKMKICIDIDDFGNGYSNLRYIRNIHADTLKLDYTLVQKAVEDHEGKSELKIVEFIINMAHTLGMNVCLEGIESEKDIAILAPLKADKYQGFLFGKPVCSYSFINANRKFLKNTMNL